MEQIGGKPIDYAILQMTFSEKRAARKVKDLLVEARDDAQRVKGLQRSKLVVGLLSRFQSVFSMLIA